MPLYIAQHETLDNTSKSVQQIGGVVNDMATKVHGNTTAINDILGIVR